MPKDRKYDLVIVGAGPAGIGAAGQARLYGLKTLVISKGDIGGRLALARRVENFPWPGGSRLASGQEICRMFKRRLSKIRVDLANGEAERIERGGEVFVISCRDGRKYQARALIVATGVRPKQWRTSGLADASMAVLGDWRQAPVGGNTRVAVVGGGEVAFDQACSLAERGAKVILLMRGDRPRAHPALAAEASKLGVRIYANTLVKAVSRLQDGGLMLNCWVRRHRCHYILPAVGHRPQLPIIDRQARLRLGRGLWLAGDVRERYCRQAAVAFGDGVRAAMLAWDHLRKGKG